MRRFLRFFLPGLFYGGFHLRIIGLGLFQKQLARAGGQQLGVLTRKFKGKPLFVPLAMNAENKAAQKKLDGPIAFFGPDSQLPASASRAEFLEKTAAWNKEIGKILDEDLAKQQKNG